MTFEELQDLLAEFGTKIASVMLAYQHICVLSFGMMCP